MKLATYRDGSRDGQLVVVSRDLTTAHYATHAAHTLQHVLDDWNFISPQLQDLYVELNHGKGRHVFPFDPTQCMAPLPRAFQFVRGVAYGSHLQLLMQAAAALGDMSPGAMPGWAQLSGDALLGATDDMTWADETFQLDFEAGWAAYTADLPAGCEPSRALEGVRLLALTNTWALRGLVGSASKVVPEPVPGAGVSAVQSRPAVAFSPVAVTPDELGETWEKGRLHAVLTTSWNRRRLGGTNAGTDMTLNMGQLLAQAAAHRPLRAGTVVCTGTVGSPGSGEGQSAQWPDGFHSVQAKRASEVLQTGCAVTDYLVAGDTVRMEMTGRDGLSVFGAIEQTVHTAAD